MAGRELRIALELCRFSRRKRRPTVVELGRLAELHAEYDEIAAAHPISCKLSYEPVDGRGVSAEWVSGPESRGNCVILYLHGGCYVSGSVETHRELISRLSIAASMRVLGLNYRLAPGHPFPAAVEDATAAYRWLIETGIEPACIAIAGDSAGAGLALAAAITLRDERLPLPGALVCISPWVDLAVPAARWKPERAKIQSSTGRCYSGGGSYISTAATHAPHSHRPCMRTSVVSRHCWSKSDRPRFCSTMLFVLLPRPRPPASMPPWKSGRK